MATLLHLSRHPRSAALAAVCCFAAVGAVMVTVAWASICGVAVSGAIC